MPDERNARRPVPGPGVLRALARRRALLLAVLLLAALALRVAAFRQAQTSPAGYWHLWEDSDAHHFDAWARRIADGDWLTRADSHPYHSWHALVAEAHFAWHPEEAESLRQEAAARGDDRDPGALLWSRWLGGPRLHQEPLYPYLVGLTYALIGPDASLVHVWQMGLGVLAIALTWLVTRRAFGDLAALLAGLAAVLYGPLLLYDLTLLRPTTLVVAGLAIVATLQAVWPSRRPLAWGALGLLCGLAVLLKTTFALLPPLLLLALADRRRSHPGRLLPCGAGLLAGVALALAPAVARNVAVGAPPFALTSVGGLNVILSLSVDSVVWPYGFVPNVDTFAEVYHQTGGDDRAVLVRTLALHDGPSALLGMFARRLGYAFHAFEAPNNVNLLAFERDVPALRVAALRFGALAAFALPGLFLALGGLRRRRAAVGALVLAVAVALLPLAVFGTLARYRVLLAAALLPFAGLAAARLLAALTARRWAAAATLALAVLTTAALAHRPLPDGPRGLRPVDLIEPYAFFWAPLVGTALQQGDVDTAATLLRRSLADLPAEVERLDAEHPARTPQEADLAAHFANVYDVLAQVLQQAGDAEGSRASAGRARALRLAAPGLD